MSDVDDDEEYERRLAALFAACDAHQDGAVDQEERFVDLRIHKARGLLGAVSGRFLLVNGGLVLDSWFTTTTRWCPIVWKLGS